MTMPCCCFSPCCRCCRCCRPVCHKAQSDWQTQSQWQAQDQRQWQAQDQDQEQDLRTVLRDVGNSNVNIKIDNENILVAMLLLITVLVGDKDSTTLQPFIDRLSEKLS